MRIAIGSDHRGDEACVTLADHLRAAGHEVEICGTCAGVSCDYPDIAWEVAGAVGAGRADRGVLICGSGIGMSIAANKIAGVRAASVNNRHDAEMCRRHNDANVLCLSADRLAIAIIVAMTDLWIAAPFDGGRHGRRVEKIRVMERGEDPRGDDVVGGATKRPSDQATKGERGGGHP
jgi:ribose 5-phosphate isomerase B